jgi:1-acyl-sn-glycerol-3-phosphate acyltransferase
MSNLNKVLSVCARKIFGIRLVITGETSCLKERGNLIIANHLGYLDGIILGSLFPVIFVTKLQVKKWPVIGWMSQVGHTVFIDRQRKLGSLEPIEKIADLLKRRINVLFFPECTSSDGSRILPFKSAYFQAVIDAGTAVIPITIQYTKLDSQDISLLNRDGVFWYGQVKFPEHLRRLLKFKNIEARITIHPKIEAKSYYKNDDSRKQISEYSRQIISSEFSYITE